MLSLIMLPTFKSTINFFWNFWDYRIVLLFCAVWWGLVILSESLQTWNYFLPGGGDKSPTSCSWLVGFFFNEPNPEPDPNEIWRLRVRRSGSGFRMGLFSVASKRGPLLPSSLALYVLAGPPSTPILRPSSGTIAVRSKHRKMSYLSERYFFSNNTLKLKENVFVSGEFKQIRWIF